MNSEFRNIIEKKYAVDKREAQWMIDVFEAISSAIHHAYNSGYLEGWNKGKAEKKEET